MAVYRPRGGTRRRSRYQPQFTNRVVSRVRHKPRDFDPDKMHVLMLSRTPVAGVPFVLKDIINKYSPHECKTLMGGAGYKDGRRWGPPDALFGQIGAAQQLLDWADVVMVHNGHVPRNLTLKSKRVLCYYHSEPHRVDHSLERRGVPTYIIAQGHSLLYAGKPVLPNLIDPADPLLQPDETRDCANGIIIAHSPSNRHAQKDMLRRRMAYSAKGWPEMQPAIERLKAAGMKFELFEGVPYKDLMVRRRKAHIIVDEVVTGSYHRCTLEAMCHGQLVVNGLSPQVRKVLSLVVGDEPVPWLVTNPKRMADDILAATSDYDRFQEMMAASRAWVVKHWDPQKLLESWYLPAFKKAKLI